MAQAQRTPTRAVYQIKVTLQGSKPPIWRRMQVTSETTFAQLHRILQRVMGWEGSHLYRFVVGGMEYGDPRMLEEMEGEDARRATLASLVQGEKAKFLYEYDFGDRWEHELLIEKVLACEAGKYYPVCLTGKRACPPEDCGGIWGYAGFLDAIQDPQHPEHEEMLAWVGGEFDPEAFDLDEVNRELQRLTPSKVKRSQQ
jgi:Plasmid pRiA4b ORF-3-like protein